MTIEVSPHLQHLANRAADATRLSLTAGETARALGISVRTFHEMTAPRGPIRCARAGRVRLYPIRELERFLESQVSAAG